MENLTQQFTVETHNTALHLGSGTLEVLATPQMIAWMENTAMKISDSHITPDETTVGIDIHAEHLKASPVGQTIAVEATLINIDGRKHTFSITCTDSQGHTIGRATHDRFVVNRIKFMAKL